MDSFKERCYEENNSLLIGLIIFCLVLGGCEMAKGNGNDIDPSKVRVEDLPKVRAFQHEFTRGFLQSITEVEEGYYPFISGTGAYKMWLPGGAQNK